MQSINQDVTKDAVVRQVMLTEGELLLWKGWWWRVHLNNDTHAVELQQGKPTTTTEKVIARATRWKRTHPNAQTSDGLRPGSVSGLRAQPAGLQSTEPRS